MTNTATKDKERAKSQARAQLGSAVEMVKRLTHAGECNGEDCDLEGKDIISGLGLYMRDGDVTSEEERADYHNEEEALRTIQEDPLCVEVRSGWHTPEVGGEPEEYTILLCTGGPAVRIIGDLDVHQQPTSAKIEYQDWFTAWEELTGLTNEEDGALLTYARQFYFAQ